MIEPRKKLFAKLLLVVLTFCVVMTAACIAIMRSWHGNFHDEISQLIAKDFAAAVTVVAPFSGPRAESDVADFLVKVSQARAGTDAYLIDGQGAVLASSLPTGLLARDMVDMDPVRLFLSQTEIRSPLYGDDPREGAGTSIFSVAPLEGAGGEGRYLYLTVRETPTEKFLLNTLRGFKFRESLSVLLISALLAVVATAVVMRILVRGLESLESAMSDFRKSGFSEVPISLTRADGAGDEIQRLTSMFIEQAELLVKRFEEVQRSDDNRRDVLASVSHDLRTPITTIMAHLETLNDSDGLSTEDRTRYFNICLQQCQNLNELVEQLLTVARLDAGEMPYEPEVFNIGELLHDIAQKHQLRANAAQVKLAVQIGSDIHTALGDIGLIERAVDNLIDNSLRHTAAGGEIILDIEASGPAIVVKVADNGEGIPKEERDKVIERFYKPDKSRTHNSGSSGLGLAIVNGIVRLHGSRVVVESEVGAGTSISFDLQRGA